MIHYDIMNNKRCNIYKSPRFLRFEHSRMASPNFVAGFFFFSSRYTSMTFLFQSDAPLETRRVLRRPPTFEAAGGAAGAGAAGGAAGALAELVGAGCDTNVSST